MAVKKSFVSITSLNSEGRQQILKSLQEYSDSLLRIDAEKEQLKSILDNIQESLGVDKKLVGKMAAIYHKANYNSVVSEAKELEMAYDFIVHGNNSGSSVTQTKNDEPVDDEDFDDCEEEF